MEGNYTSGRPSKLIRSFAQLLLHLLTILRSNLAPTTRLPTGGGLAMPARIQMAGPTLEDGLQTKRTPPRTTTWWFHYQVPLEDHSWAHEDGDPTRRISSLEMFGTSSCSWEAKALLRTRLSLISDNQGNIFALLNQKTKQMPTSAFLMQLIVMLHIRQGFSVPLRT